MTTFSVKDLKALEFIYRKARGLVNYEVPGRPPDLEGQKMLRDAKQAIEKVKQMRKEEK